MSTVRLVLWFLALNAAIMGALLLERERRIAKAWRQMRAGFDFERSKVLLDRCFDLLVEHYGADTFAAPQLTDTPVLGSDGPDRYAVLAALAGERWQVALPPIQFRLVQSRSQEVAGTYGRSLDCSVVLDSGAGERGVGLQWNEVHEIGLATSVLTDSDALPIVVAHEVSHLVLGRDQVSVGNWSDDEILTDVATALLGYGLLMQRLRSRTVRRFHSGRGLSFAVSGPGYLYPEELIHILARQAAAMSPSQ